MSSADSKPIIHNAGAFCLQPRGISVIVVQTTPELDTQHISILDTSSNLPLGIIPLVIEHNIDHKYPKSLGIPILNTAYDRVCTPRATVTSTLCPVKIECNGVSNISWTTTENGKPAQEIATEFLIIPPESSFQLEHHKSNIVDNITRCTSPTRCTSNTRS